jgi:hypothetical protein
MIRFLQFVVVSCCLWTGVCRAGEPQLVTGDYLDSPVYYELHEPAPYLQDNRELLHRNQLSLRYFPEVDVTGFDWKNGGPDDFSWWIQVEELRFLLPLIRSTGVEDRELARAWFRSWYESNKTGTTEHRARWKYPMSAAYRAMVLVFLLKTERVAEEQDAGLIAMLREVILQHRDYLADAHNFESDNNHGLVEAFALLELCRVFPDGDLETAGLQRMLRITRASVSPAGLHMEHSPAYHFAFLGWLTGFVEYLSGVERFNGEHVARMTDFADRMRSASFFMHDHDGAIPEIGDTDSMNVFSRYPQYIVSVGDDPPRAIYDPAAGFAVFKDARRYAVFSIQTARPFMREHFHDDLLAVYFRCGGETILGDAGKYSYTQSQLRRYFMSMPAHNSVFPGEYVAQGWSYFSLALADSTYGETVPDTTRFVATANHAVFMVRRSVTAAHHGDGIEIVDDIRPNRDSRRGASSVVWTWNFGYDVQSVRPAGTQGDTRIGYELETGTGRRLRFEVGIDGAGGPIRHEIVRGRSEPRCGWYSPELYVVRPSSALRLEIPLSERIVTRTRVFLPSGR